MGPLPAVDVTRAALIVALAALGGCATPELSRFGKDSSFQPSPAYRALLAQQGRPNVEIYAYTPPTPPTPAPPKIRLRDLSDHGQAAFVEGAFRSPDRIAAVKSLAASALAANEESAAIALAASTTSTLERTLVIDVTKGLAFEPGDRLSWTEITIVPQGWRFAGYSIAATKHETVDVAQLEDTQSTQANASIAPTFASDLAGTGAFGISFGRDRTVSSTVQQRYTDLSVGVRPELLRITRESERNRDVSGNTFIALALDYGALVNDELKGVATGFLATGLKLLNASGTPLPAESASADLALVSYPAACPLRAEVTFAYELRRAGPDGRTFVEGDDKARYERDVIRKRVDVVPADEVRPKLWRIVGMVGSEELAVGVAAPLGYEGQLLFASFDDARQFARWMNEQAATTIGRNRTPLLLNGKPLAKRRDWSFAPLPLPRPCNAS